MKIFYFFYDMILIMKGNVNIDKRIRGFRIDVRIFVYEWEC